MTTRSASARTWIKLGISSLAGLALATAILSAARLPCLAAASDLIERISVGHGASEAEARDDALIQAVRQSGGVKVESERQLRTSLKETANGPELTSDIREHIDTISKGLIHSFEVLSLTNQDQSWVVTLRVLIPVYRPPEPKGADFPTIVVLPFHSGIAQGSELARALEHKLTSGMVGAEGLRVVDREFVRDLDSQDARLALGNAPDTELARRGHELGADYSVVGEITRWEVKTEPGRDQLDEVSLTVEYRVIVSATREVCGAGTPSATYSREVLEQLGLRADAALARDRLLSSLAFWIVTDIQGLIHPAKPGKLSVSVTPGVRYALYANGMRQSAEGADFCLPAERDLSLLVVADGYEPAQRNLKLREDCREAWNVALAPAAMKVLELAEGALQPTYFRSAGAKKYLVTRLGTPYWSKLAEGQALTVKCANSNYVVRVASVNPESYTLSYLDRTLTRTNARPVGTGGGPPPGHYGYASPPTAPGSAPSAPVPRVVPSASPTPTLIWLPPRVVVPRGAVVRPVQAWKYTHP